jgi:uncharacterized cofD-like protein
MTKKIKKVVTIGGGNGNSMLLSGLKHYPISLSTIVTMSDDGGSSGVLRKELGVLPPGDVRQCLLALSDTSDTMRNLMKYRFEEGGLKGHNFGNLFLSALEKITGDFSVGVSEAAKILKIRGEVIPVTNANTNLFMLLKNGKLLKGEIKINHNLEIEKKGIGKNYLAPRARANQKAIESILEADLVVIGPGNFYCSIMPNFLVEGISEALRKTKAKVVYNCTLVNKKGHTEKFTLDDYVEKLNEQIGKNRIDFVTFNTRKPGKKLIAKNEKELLVNYSPGQVKKRNYRVIEADLLSDEKVSYSKGDAVAATRTFLLHDSEKLARVLMAILGSKHKESINKIV